MRSIWREIVMSLCMGFILPGIVMNWAVEDIPELPAESSPKETVPVQTDSGTKLTMKLRQTDGTVVTMDLDEYLVGVVVGEMPADFEEEAKKAQAVVARTFARKAYVTGGKHGDGSVCTSSGCCQAYLSVAEYLARGGSQDAVDGARTAVEATSGLVLTYDGKLIEATYFSCSGGSTEDAVAVWGTDVPYLRSVESPGEEYATHYSDTVHYTKKEFADKLGLNLTGNPESWFGDVVYTSGGGIETLVIGGETFTGTQLRSKLGLRSTAITIEADSEGITITTKGFGHRVGMSQYGADAMAMGGSIFEEILAHYYPGTTLELTKTDE